MSVMAWYCAGTDCYVECIIYVCNNVMIPHYCFSIIVKFGMVGCYVIAPIDLQKEV
jgi:hypothetical protein